MVISNRPYYIYVYIYYLLLYSILYIYSSNILFLQRKKIIRHASFCTIGLSDHEIYSTSVYASQETLRQSRSPREKYVVHTTALYDYSEVFMQLMTG